MLVHWQHQHQQQRRYAEYVPSELKQSFPFISPLRHKRFLKWEVVDEQTQDVICSKTLNNAWQFGGSPEYKRRPMQ
jgi:hypothetical protein